jgi:hypothetical protein
LTCTFSDVFNPDPIEKAANNIVGAVMLVLEAIQSIQLPFQSWELYPSLAGHGAWFRLCVKH